MENVYVQLLKMSQMSVDCHKEVIIYFLVLEEDLEVDCHEEVTKADENEINQHK